MSAPAFAIDTMEDWLADQKPRQRRKLAEAVRGQASTQEQQAALDRLVRDYEVPALAASHYILPVVQGLAGSTNVGDDLAVACGLNWAGSHCLDDLQDGDLEGDWKARSPADVTFVCIAAATIIPPLLLARLDVDSATRLGLQESWCALNLSLICGQTDDLDRSQGRRDADDLEAVADSVGRREPFGWWFCMAAQLSGETADAAREYLAFGHQWGIAKSTQRDFAQLLIDEDDSDLRNGTRTLHIAICETAMAGAERVDFQRLRHAARTEPSAREEIRSLLRRERHVVPVHGFLTDRLDRAARHLEQAAPPEPLATHLRGMTAAPPA